MGRVSSKFDTLQSQLETVKVSFICACKQANGKGLREEVSSVLVLLAVKWRMLFINLDSKAEKNMAVVQMQIPELKKLTCTKQNYPGALPRLILSVWEVSTATSFLLDFEGQLKYHCTMFFSTGSFPHRFLSTFRQAEHSSVSLSLCK